MNAPTAILPTPRCGLSIRLAVQSDLPFIDHLQKMHTHMAGFFPRKQMEGYLAHNGILIAEEVRDQKSELRAEPAPLGYIVFRDTYSGRDDVGMVYQLNVMPLKQRHLIGASLVKAAFEKAAYGVRLFSCWCAQDIAANFFWEAIGFVPLAFRTGTRSKQRTHIFWQKRIREGDAGVGATPWWFPSQTKSGAFREDRLVFPIPTGVHWRDPMPVVLPELPAEAELPRTLPGGAPVRQRPEGPKVTHSHRLAVVRAASKHLKGTPAGKASVVTASGLRYIERGDYEPDPLPAKPKREPRPPAPKHDPADIARVRELRDRFLEQVNGDPSLLLPAAKYELVRALPASTANVIEVKALPEAA